MYQYIFTQDWFAPLCTTTWPKLLEHLKGKPDIHYLEIGTFEGKSVIWLLQNYWTDKTSTITTIDTFQGSAEHNFMRVDNKNTYINYLNNIKESGAADRITTYVGRSDEVLPILLVQRKREYDLIYIDGSHTAYDVLFDAVCSWKLLKKNGIMIFDDYLWQMKFPDTEKPGLGIEGFLKCHKDQYEEVQKAYQFVIRKL